MKLRILPLFLTTLLMAAHFLRSNSLLLMFLCLAAPALLFIKHRWSLIVLKCFTFFYAMIWLYTLFGIIQERTISGRSWLASAIILGLVAIFSLFSGWLLNAPQVMKGSVE